MTQTTDLEYVVITRTTRDGVDYFVRYTEQGQMSDTVWIDQADRFTRSNAGCIYAALGEGAAMRRIA